MKVRIKRDKDGMFDVEIQRWWGWKFIECGVSLERAHENYERWVEKQRLKKEFEASVGVIEQWEVEI